MTKSFFIFFGVLLIVSCSSKNKVPAGVLDQQRMQAVMWDLIRADEFVVGFVKFDSVHNRKDESTRLYEEVFKIHKTNRAQFKKSVDFYGGHPEMLKVIFDSLENRKSIIMQDIHHKPSPNDPARKTADSTRRRIADSTRKKLKLVLPK